jgi:tetratricopeptide (TPR) repeat protein
MGALLVLALAGCREQQSAPTAAPPSQHPWFVEHTSLSGIEFIHDAGPAGRYWMPQAIGSGAALFDFDNDGRLDILLLQNGGRQPASGNRLYHQQPGGRFVDASAGSGLDTKGQAMGVAVGDANRDGLADVLVTEFGGLKFFLNRGGGKFLEIARQAGLESPLWGASASFCDYDRDGWLDLVIVNYVAYDPARPCLSAAGVPDFCAPKEFEGTVTKLYRNTTGGSSSGAGSSARAVRFEDMTLDSGLGRLTGPGLGVLCADFNADRWPDIFVANDGQPNRLWINRQDGTFLDEAVLHGVAYNAQGAAEASMGVAWADVDGRQGADLFVTHLTEERHTLWLQEAPGLFLDRTARSGIAAPASRGTGFGTVLADFDLDGDVDLAIVNGRVSQGTERDKDRLGAFWCRYAEQNQVFENDGSGQFSNESSANRPFCSQAGVYRSLACGDIDNDGDLDLLVTQVAGPALLFRNVAPRRGHWLVVRAVDPTLKGDSYGAEVHVKAGNRSWSRLINPGYSYLSSNDPRAHFGLGQAGHIDELRIVWPDGKQEQFTVNGIDRLVVVTKGTGRAAAARPGAPEAAAKKFTDWRPQDTSDAPQQASPTAVPADVPMIDLAEVDPPVREAIEAARASILRDRDAADAWGQLGMLLFAHGLAPDAVQRCFAVAERLAPKSPRWPYLAGLALAATDPQAAIARLHRAVELTSEPYDAPRLRFAEVLLAEDRLDDATRQFEQVLRSCPGNVRAELGLGRAAARRGAPGDAVVHLRRAAEDPRTRKSAHLVLAEAYQRLGNEPEARRSAHQAAVLPHDAPWPDRYTDELVQLRRGRRAALAVADGLLARERPAEAAAAVQAALNEYPDLGWAWLLLGRAQLQLQQPHNAERSLRRSIELLPESIESYFYLGVALLQQRRLPAASEAFATAAKQAPDFALAHLYHGLCQKRLGQPADAMKAFRSSLEAKPDLAAAHVELAELLVDQDEYREAREHVRQSLQIEPNDRRAKALLRRIEASQPDAK